MKKKWYKNKGGWIGAVVGLAVWWFQLLPFENVSGNVWYFLISHDSTTGLFSAMLMLILGFLIGSFIYNKLKRRKHG